MYLYGGSEKETSKVPYVPIWDVHLHVFFSMSSHKKNHKKKHLPDPTRPERAFLYDNMDTITASVCDPDSELLYLSIASNDAYDFEEFDTLINWINWDKYPNGIPPYNEDFFGEANDKIEKTFYEVPVDVGRPEAKVVDTPKQDESRRCAPVETPRKRPRLAAPKQQLSYSRDFVDPKSPATVYVASYGMDTTSNPEMQAFNQKSGNEEPAIVPVGYSSYFSLYAHKWVFRVVNENNRLCFEVVSESTDFEPEQISSGLQETPSAALRQCIVKFIAHYPESSMGSSGDKLRVDTNAMLKKINARLYLGLYGTEMQREFSHANFNLL